MDINVKINHMAFDEFIINENIRQCTVPDSNTRLKEGFFFYKLKCENGCDAVFYRSYYNNNVHLGEYNKYESCAFIDYENKFVIYNPHYGFDFDYTIFDNHGYKPLHKRDYEKSIAEIFKAKVQEILDNNFDKYMKCDSNYKEEYNAVAKNIKEAEESLLYRNGQYFLPSNNYKPTFNIEELIKLTRSPEYMDKFIEAYMERHEKTLKSSHAREKAREHTLTKIKENPSERVKLVSKIKEAIKDAGKTLNITTIVGQVIKVHNELRMDDCFQALTGYRRVNCNEIEKITFGKKVLYEDI